MDMEEFNKAFESGHLNKVHIDFIIGENIKLKHKLITVKETLLAVRDESYRRSTDAKKLIDETLASIREG